MSAGRKKSINTLKESYYYFKEVVNIGKEIPFCYILGNLQVILNFEMYLHRRKKTRNFE